MPYQTDIPIWQLPQPSQVGGLPSWVVVFLCKVDDENNERILKKLCTLDQTWEDAPAGDMRPLVPMPWIRDFTPPISVIFDIFEQTNYTDGLIFVDEQSLLDDTAIVLDGYYGPEKMMAARVQMDRANLTLSASMKRTLADVMPDFEKAKVVPEPMTQNRSGGDYEIVHHLPAHIPVGLEIQQSTLTLVSLVHLSEEDLKSILSQPWQHKNVHDVRIINWPAEEELCTRATLHRVFQTVKTPRLHDIDQAFMMFIDDLGEEHKYTILLAQEFVKESSTNDELVHLSEMKSLQDAVDVWHMIWNPNRWEWRGVGDNDVSFKVNVDLEEKLSSTIETFHNPDRLALSAERHLVFVLDQMSQKEVWSIWEIAQPENELGVQFIDVSHLIKTPDMEGLLKFFESEQFLSTGQKPPSYLFAADRRSLEAATGDDQDASCILLAARKDVILMSEKPRKDAMLEGDEPYGCQCLGYDYDRLNGYDASEAATDLHCQNIESFEISEDLKTVYFDTVKEWTDKQDGFGRNNQHLKAYHLEDRKAWIGQWTPRYASLGA